MEEKNEGDEAMPEKEKVLGYPDWLCCVLNY